MNEPLKELKKAPWWVPVASLGFMLWLVNWFFYWMGWNPFLYCWGMGIAPLFGGWFQIVKLALLAWFALLVWRKALIPAAGAGLVLTVVYGAPVFWKTLTYGGVCQ